MAIDVNQLLHLLASDADGKVSLIRDLIDHE
ncbi:MAG: hypothetical protein Solivirus3_14 [Solivirus sp.]|uniref:Uncharacterized protein n=1 Tax=Solivirus sp. TaxID=2487772 RepID=A0A3G5AHE8_9VIRU|nr:MAG: hypothetical protein Solivirus3_14 [Solivirus sp.]